MITVDEELEVLRANQLGGISEALDLSLSHGGWWVPEEIGADEMGTSVRYRWHEPVVDPIGRPRHRIAPATEVRSTRSLLLDFLGLVNAEDAAVVAFAARFGPLRLCTAHGLLETHESPVGCPVVADAAGWASESCAAWRRHASILRHATDLGAILQAREAQATAEARVLIEHALAPWLASAAVVFRWGSSGPETTWTPGCLSGALGIEAALSIGRADRVAVCAGCGVMVRPKRKPRSDSWCDAAECRKVRNRRTVSRHREKHPNHLAAQPARARKAHA